MVKLLIKPWTILLLVSIWLFFSASAVPTCAGDGKIKVSESELESAVNEVLWMAPDYKYLFVHTERNVVWLSKDGGRTWESQMQYMQGAGTLGEGVYKIYRTPDSNVLYFLGAQLWVTKDKGATYQVVRTQGHNFVEIQVHPVKAAWVLAMDYSPGCFEQSSNDACNRRLYLTQNAGQDWRLLDTYVYQYTWGSAGLANVHENNIWVLDWPDKTGPQFDPNQILQKDIDDLELRHSEDFLQTKIDHPITNVIFLLAARNNIYFARLQDNKLEMYVSEDNGKSFAKANFPFKDLQETQYTILDDTEGQVFMAVSHGPRSWSNLYTSDRLGSNYELSLEYIRRPPVTSVNEVSFPDFAKVRSLEGIYLANALQDVRAGGQSSGAKSFITFDKGAEWQTLSVALYSDGALRGCNESDCTLNLNIQPKRGENSFYQLGPIHTSREAVGLILATGNVGQRLETDSTDPSIIHTYLSRDGGWTWYDIRPGSHIYEFADHGSLILMTDNMNPTDSFVYTPNQGLSFTTCQFTPGIPISVRNILVEPGVKSEEFIVHGVRRTSEGTVQGVIVHADFNNYFARDCVYPNDYEWFSPADHQDWNCLLGQNFTYSRRKRASECFNGDDYEKAQNITTCPCTPRDYACDFCYEWYADSKVCGKVKDCVPPPRDEPCVGFYNVSNGYRLVVGDKCNPTAPGAVNLLPTMIPCGKKQTSGGNTGLGGGFIALIVLVICAAVFAILGTLLYLYRQKALSLHAPYQFALKTKRKDAKHLEEESTALDDDLLEAKEADELDDNAIKETLQSSSVDDEFNPRTWTISDDEPTLI